MEKLVFNQKDGETMHDLLHNAYSVIAIQFGEQQCPICGAIVLKPKVK